MTRQIIITILLSLATLVQADAARPDANRTAKIVQHIKELHFRDPGSKQLLQYLEANFPYLRNQPDSAAYFYACNKYADWLFRHASLDQIKNASRRICELASDSDNPELIATARRAQGQYMLRLGLPKLAGGYIRDAMSVCPDYSHARSYETYASVATLMVRTYLSEQKADSADIILRKLDSMLDWMVEEQKEDPRNWLRTRVYALHAAAELSRGNLTLCNEWMENCRKAIVPGVPIKFYPTYYITNYHLAMRQGNYNEALEMVDMLLDKANVLPLRGEYLLQKAKILQHLGRWEEATKAYAIYIDEGDRSQRQTLAERLSYLRNSFEFERTMNEKRAAEHELMLFTVASAALLVALIVAIWAMVVLRKKNRHLVRLLRNNDNQHRQDSSADANDDSSDTNDDATNADAAFEKALGNKGMAFMDSSKAYNEPDGGRATLAAHLGVSERVAISAVAAAAGCSFKTYVNAMRLEHSRRLLEQDTSTPIADIATQCGFGTIRNYQTLFKEKYGLSPSQYRNSLG